MHLANVINSVITTFWGLFMTYQRPFVDTLLKRFSAEKPLIQVLVGPRQVGKTTGVRQLLELGTWPYHYANADDVLISDRNWLLLQWQQALLSGDGALLVIDEIQKVPNWPETIKALWDARPGRLRVLLLGSSALQIQAGITESLAGRFELLRVHHWRFAELRHAFAYDLPRYLTYGGYPGAVAFEHDPDRWFAYMKDAIVESVIGKDILQSHKVTNQALFRQAFQILCAYPAQEISYTKLLGQLQDKGNTDLVKHYIDLYGGAFLLHALQKYSPKAWLARSSSPKMLPACPALYSMVAGVNVTQNADQRGRAFELAVGAELVQQPGQVFYWREGQDEVDFVYQYRDQLYAIEVKSGRKKSAKGLASFCAQTPQALRIIITPENFTQFSDNPVGFLQQVAL
jgi:predicted AAA+ superfamily ATPase